MNDDVLLKVEGVHLSREGTEILHGVDLAINEAEIHCLLGRNGSGKSTMAYMLMGSGGYNPSGGRVLFGGKDVTDATMTERARLGLTLAWQEPARFEGLPVLEYLRLGMTDASEERVREALEAVALAPDAYKDRNVDSSLSGGERKRIELAAVYAMRPRLAVLDEPDSGVDVLSLSDIRDLFTRMRDQGSALLLITHRDEMVEIADRASLICSGEIVMTGEPAQVQARYCDRCEVCNVAQEVEEATDYERI